MGTKAIIAFVFAAFIAAAQDQTRVRTEKLPFDFARYIDTHTNIDWASLWLSIGTGDPVPPYLPRCVPDDDGPCSTELITVLDPSQIIVLVSSPTRRDHYFRFLEANGGWAFGGYYGSWRSPTEHGLFRVGGRPFLRISEKNTLGSDIYAELQGWFDLTAPNLEPVFTFPVEANINQFVFGIGRKITGTATPNRTGAIDLSISVEFTFGGKQVGVETFVATYERRPGEKFEIKNAQVAATRARIDNALFEELANADSDLTNDQMLVYALPGLKEIASGKDAELKNCLKQMLDPLRDSSEKRTLLDLLNRR